MKKSTSFIVSIMIFGAVTACSVAVKDKSATKKTKERITEADKKSVVEKTADKEKRDKEIEVKEWMARGYEAYKIEDYDKAIEYYKKAIALNPDNAKAHYNLGVNYSNKWMLDEAISEYKKALTINPNHAEAHNNLGNIYSKKGMLDEAISEYKKAVTVNPNLANAHYNLGHSYFEKGLNSLAADHLHKAGLLSLKQHNREGALNAYRVLKQTKSKELEQSLFEKLQPEVKQKKSEPSK